MEGLHFDISLNDHFSKEFQKIQDHVKQTSKEIERSGVELEQYFDRIKSAATMALAGFSAKGFIQSMTRVRSEFQQLEVAFTTMLGSEEKALTLMEQLTKTAATTPFDLQGVASGAKQLLAYGIAADKVNDTLIHLGDIAAGLSIPLNDLVYLYGTTMTQGRMYTQDLRQFMNRGIPLVEELAKQFGVAKEKVGELVTAGKVGAKEFEQALMGLSSEGGKFAGLMEAQSKTIKGQISNIEDSIDVMFNELGKKSEGVINATLSGISFLVENYETVGKVILSVAAAYGTYKAALLAVVAAQKLATVWGNVQAFFSLAKSVTSAKDAMVLFNTVCKASPVGLILGAVTSAAVAFGLFSTSSDGASAAVEKYGKSATDTMQRVETLTKELNGLTKGSTLHKQVMDELNEILTEYGVAQVQESDNLDMVNGKREKTIELIKQEAIERQRLNSLEEGGNTYSEAVKNARAQLLKDLKEAGTFDALGFETWGEDEIRTNAEAISRIVANVAEENISLIAEKTGTEFYEGMNRMFGLIQERMRRIGISEDIIQKEWYTTGLEFTHDNIISKYLVSLKMAKDEYVRFSSAINAIADGDAQAIERNADKAREAADFSQMSTENLITKIAELKGACDAIDREIDIRIKFGAAIDFNTDDVLDFTDLQNAQAELRNRMNKATTDEAVDTLLKELREGKQKAEYGSQARSLYEQYIRELERKKTAHSGRITTRGGSDPKRELVQRMEEERRWNEQLLSYQQQASNAMEEARIAGIASQGERERQQAEYEHRQRLAQIERQAEDMRRAVYEHNKRAWENAHKDSPYELTEEGRKGWAGIVLTSDQQAVIDAQVEKENEEYRRATEARMKEQSKANQEAINAYLRQYGDYAQKRQAITADSNARIRALNEQLSEATTEEAKAAAQARIDTVKAETERQLSELDIQYGKARAFMVDLFEDASEKSVSEIDKIIRKYDALVQFLNGDGSVTRQQLVGFGFTDAEIDKALQKLDTEGVQSVKAITDAIKELKGELEGRSPWLTFTSNLGKAIKQLKEAKGNVEAIGKGVGGIGETVSAFSPQVKQLSSGISNIFGFDDSKIQSAIDGLEGLGTTAVGVGQIMSGDVVGGVMNTANGISKTLDALEDMFGADYSSYNSLVEQYNRLAEVWDTLIDRKSEYIGMSYGAETIQVGKETLDIIGKQAEAYRELGRARLNAGASAGSHAIGRRMADATSTADWQAIAASLGMSVTVAQDLIGTSRMTGLFNLTAEQLRNLQENNQAWWANIDNDVRKYLESIIDNEERWKAVHEQVMQQLTTTTKENVFSDFLDSLYSLADGSEDVTEDIAKNWQQMVNRMVVNNLVAGKYQEQLEKWYESLYEANQLRSERAIDNTEYMRRLDTLKHQYEEMTNSAQKEIEQFTEAGIVKPMEDAAKQTLITLDTIKDGWMGMLMDMTADVDDWSQDIAKKMTEALIENNIFNDEWEELQKDWLERYQDAIDNTRYSDVERKMLLKGLQEDEEAWVEEARRKAKQIYDITGYDTASSREQSASVQATERITVDQADELIGRMNAGQMIWEQHKELTRRVSESLAAMQTAVGTTIGTDVTTLVSLAATRNQYLDSLVEVCRSIRNDMTMQMEDLRRDIKNI